MGSLALIKPALVLYSQRIDGAPYVNCLPYSICSVLRWMGYDVPDRYGMTLRKASGVPVAPGQGTSYAHMQKALASILPKAPVTFGKVTEDELFNDLPKVGKRNRYKDVYSVVVHMEKLPRWLRRHVGFTWEGRHAIVVGGQRVCNGADGLVGQYDHSAHRNERELWWMDPMGRPSRGYAGDWALMTDVLPALARANDAQYILCVHGQRKTAV